MGGVELESTWGLEIYELSTYPSMYFDFITLDIEVGYEAIMVWYNGQLYYLWNTVLRRWINNSHD